MTTATEPKTVQLSEDVQKVESVNTRWKWLIESKDPVTSEDLGFDLIEGRDRKRDLARLLENTHKESLSEAMNVQAGVDYTDTTLMNIVRRTAPNLLAYDLVGVQPMSQPTGLIFAIRAHYGDQPTGPFGRPGDARNGHQTGSALDSNGDTVAQSYGTNGQAPNEAFYNEANTVFSGTGTQSPNDGSVAYTAYSVGEGFSTAFGETLGGSESGDGVWGEMSFTIDKTSVEAKTRGLKAEYSTELQQDLRAVHGLDADSVLTDILSNELLAEQSREITNRIRQVAKISPAEKLYSNGSVLLDSAGDAVLGTVGLFDIDLNSDGRWQAEKLRSLLLKINKEANNIAKDTRRGRGNFIICSSDVASALDLAGKLDYAPGVDNNLAVDDTGVTFVGVLQGRFKVYIDPYVYYDEIIVGFKGGNQMDAGFFYCPYVPLQMHRAIDPGTFQPKIGFKTRYGIVANPFTTLTANGNSYYRKFKVGNL